MKETLKTIVKKSAEILVDFAKEHAEEVFGNPKEMLTSKESGKKKENKNV